jgi:hypothetical protein
MFKSPVAVGAAKQQQLDTMLHANDDVDDRYAKLNTKVTKA